MKRLGQVGLHSPGGALIVALFVSALVLAAAEQRQAISKIAGQERTALEYAHWVAIYEEIGQVVNHSHRTLIFFNGEDNYDWGWPLMYHGRLSGKNWPYPYELKSGRRLSPERRIKTLYPKRPPEYFIISKNWWAKEWRNREDYKNLERLLKGFPKTRGKHYIVFELRKQGKV
jgi:hypothetical protein